MKYTHPNRDSIRATLSFLASSGMPVHHKTLLIEIATQALRRSERKTRSPDPDRSRAWETEELRVIETQLHGKVAISWQHADELLTGLSRDLRRTSEDTRSKAIELGFGAGVDFRVARALSEEAARVAAAK